MAERPLLILPTPERIDPPPGPRGGDNIRRPSREAQAQRLQPVFQKLQRLLDSDSSGAMEIRDDPSCLAPESVIVFEIAGTVNGFARAVARVPGLEFLLEYDTEQPPDELFAVEDMRQGREGGIRDDKAVPGRFYLAMPNEDALRQLLNLWKRWSRGERLGRGFTPFEHVFSQLRDLRRWGAKDRILDETIDYWREEFEREPDRAVKTEVDLCFYDSNRKREEASKALAKHVKQAGGQIIKVAIIPEINYHGALIDIPAQAVASLIKRQEVHLAVAEEVMFLRPQSVLQSDLELEDAVDQKLDARARIPVLKEPIAALLDGVPVQRHDRLNGRLRIDDPDGLEALSTLSTRIHGTAMASLILHGDLNVDDETLNRPLYFRPIMFAPDNGKERTNVDQLLIDTLYRAVVRMKGSEGEDATAPTVFLINLSIGDPRRPFTGMVSPLARLLDFLSYRYGVLFLVSGGNMRNPLVLNRFSTWTDFENATAKDRERAVLEAINETKHERTILSPAESLNALTIGSQHHDQVAKRPPASHAFNPYDHNELPNASSALGLGIRRAIKPEIYLPGGREHVCMGGNSGGGIQACFMSPQRLYGLRAAAPNSANPGKLDSTALTDGTSSATALATRAAHRIFDALMDRQGGSLLADMPTEYYAVVVKALLVHRAKWNGKSDLIREICGPSDGRRYVERAENVSRFMGFGVPNTLESMECARNRATLVGYGDLAPNRAQSYLIPLPASLKSVTYPRTLTITLAWFSPVKPRHQRYRCVRFEASPDKPKDSLGIDNFKEQPAYPSVKKGTVFHKRYHGARAVPFINNGHLSIKVWCREDARGVDEAIRYGVAVTLESEAMIPIYDEIRARLRVAPLAP